MVFRGKSCRGTAALGGLLPLLSVYLRALRSGCGQVFGIPDYNRYLAHMAEHHPEQVPLSRKQFVEKAIDSRYGRSGPRCC